MASSPPKPEGLGYFWQWSGDGPPNLDDEEVSRGHVRLSDGWAEVEVLNEDARGGLLAGPEESSDCARVASLREDTILLSEAYQSGFNRNLGGGRASVEHLRSRTVVGGVPIAGG